MHRPMRAPRVLPLLAALVVLSSALPVAAAREVSRPATGGLAGTLVCIDLASDPPVAVMKPCGPPSLVEVEVVYDPSAPVPVIVGACIAHVMCIHTMEY